MNKYRVLWFDDECNALNSFIDDAADFGIDLVGYSNADDGIEELNANYLQYDAIILDGLFYSNKNQTGEVSTTIGFGKTVKAIEKLQVQGVILPCFVLSGQSSIHTANDTVIELFKDSHSANHKFFKKNDEDFKCLCNEIIKACKDKNNTIIRHKYQKVFDAIDSHFSESDTAKYLLKILKAIEQPNVDFDDSLYFTEIRIIIEHVFRKSNKIGLLHDKCLLNAKVNLTESCLFLSGEPTKHLGVKCK
ncbi:MAG: hypothetical protein PHW82_13145, partial [Bacteroidales bacterium]|nr:hypothetical protein [Bacteroidales bacterium]